MNSLTAAVNKKRKKSETKPQAQINKCNNEKRRREQENIYIEELAELISANFADMSSLSVKPDKCAILQEAVNQIRTIKQQESTASADPVQQGEVSSSRPTILSNEVYGPLLLEALEGFLFVINGEGKVEHLTDNISTYIKFTKEDVLGKSIYNFIHHGDHAKFHSNLHPMTIEWGTNPNTNNEQLISNNNKSKSIDIRLLIKPPDDLDETIEEKQQRISSYELMHISSTQLRDSITDGNTQQRDNSGPFMLCVASRISQRTACTIEQFTTKLDANAFKVICVDTSGLSDAVALFIRRELKNRGLRDLVPQQEVHKVTAHLRETVNCGQSTSAIYRLQIGPDKLVQVQTKSKLFRTTPGSREDSDFIMATHSIIGDNELSGGNSDPPSTGSGTNTASSGVGGPLMPSVVNGNRIPSSEDTILTSTNTTFNTFHLDNEYFDIFPSSTWELDSSNWQQQQQQQQSQQQENRPDSTPTPNSSSSYSANSPNVATIVQSSSFTTTTTTPVTSNAYYFNSLSTDGVANANFGGLDERDDNKVNILDESNNKLRILLTKPQTVNNNVNNCDGGGDDKNKDRILKELLNQQDEDGMRSDNRGSPRGLLGRSGSLPGTSDQSKSASPGTGNDMLRKLLNDKSDDDDLESRSVGMKKKSELLQQLLKLEREPDDDKKNEHSCTDDTLMRSLGFPSSPTDRTRKRSIEDKDDNTPSSKRTTEGPQVSSSGASMGNSLRERNKMLASLLEKNPSNHQPIPPIPASVISATPQEKLPRISDPNKTIQMGMNQNTRMTVNRMAGRPSQQTTNYLNVLSNNNNTNNNNNIINSRRIVSNAFLSSVPSSSTDNQNQIWEPGSADPLLSELLDQVIDFVPDEIMHLLDGAEGQQNTNYALSEAVAINNIQKSLMQCEGAVKSPGSPIGTPPAYSAANLSNQNNSGSVFPPPPNYSQAKFQRMQIRSAGGTSQQFAANLQLQQRKQLIYQEQQKRRLLLQQKQQHLLIPSNAANNEISNNINSIQSIDSLLNNTVAPNVSLQRSSSVPNESQLSPPYGQTGRLSSQQQQQQAAQQQQQQQPYSPHSQLTSPVYPQTTSYQGSAQSPAQAQFNAQLSPRQAYPQNSNSWQQQQARMGVQQNTMLSAQLTRPPQQQQRSINSPGSVSSRHSPYPTNEQFSSPNSPNSPFNSQYLRLPRTNSVPNATTQLPGGLSSPRPYTSRDHHPHLYPPVPHPHSVPPMMGYQQDSPQYCYDQTGLPLAYNGGPERGRAPPPHLQPGVSGSAPTSEFVRQELRAVVGARTAHAQPGANAPPNRPPSQLHQQQVNDLETLGLHFEMASGASESPKLWGEMGSMSPQPVNSRSTMEEGRQGDQKSSLLQKLLSE